MMWWRIFIIATCNHGISDNFAVSHPSLSQNIFAKKEKKKLKRQWNWSCARNLMCVCRWQFSREAPFLFVPFLKNGHESSRSWLCRRLPFYLQRWRGEVDQEALLKCTSPPLLIHSLLTAAGSVPKGRKNLAKFQFQKRLLLHCKKKKKKTYELCIEGQLYGNQL